MFISHHISEHRLLPPSKNWSTPRLLKVNKTLYVHKKPEKFSHMRNVMFCGARYIESLWGGLLRGNGTHPWL